jgi:SAM-dependent methyltransferase
VLNKLKEIFMADKVIPRGKEWPDERQGVLENWQPAEELKPLDTDENYLQNSAEAVGYANQETQWDAYRDIITYLDEGDSVLDFGCGRGDFKSFHDETYTHDLDYIGIDINENLINAGKQIYKDSIDIRCIDWNSISDDLIQDWCINVGSLNLRYDADIKTNDTDYLKNTIHTMYKHANKGVVLLLTSDLNNIDDGLINRNAGDILNWATKEFGSVALDHSFSDELFILVIYK